MNICPGPRLEWWRCDIVPHGARKSSGIFRFEHHRHYVWSEMDYDRTINVGPRYLYGRIRMKGSRLTYITDGNKRSWNHYDLTLLLVMADGGVG